jgi:phosphoglycolate phosphatase-like HAD superfamily hydrolase
MFEKKNIFVDLDETLIHTDTSSTLKGDPELQKIAIMGNVFQVKLRPGALALLKALRKKGDVFILTRNTATYALAMSNKFKFEFTEDTIFDIEYVNGWKSKKLNIPNGNNYLIDDLKGLENYEKIALLKQLGDVKYIKVNPYMGNALDAMTKEDIKDILKEI